MVVEKAVEREMAGSREADKWGEFGASAERGRSLEEAVSTLAMMARCG